MAQELDFYLVYRSADLLFLTLSRIPDHGTFRSDVRIQPSLKMSGPFPQVSTTACEREKKPEASVLTA